MLWVSLQYSLLFLFIWSSNNCVCYLLHCIKLFCKGSQRKVHGRGVWIKAKRSSMIVVSVCHPWPVVASSFDGAIPLFRYGVIFPLFVNYLFDIPRVAQTSVLGIPITGKTLTYLLGLQVCSTSAATAISACAGIVSNNQYLYHIFCNFFYYYYYAFLSHVCPNHCFVLDDMK